MKIKRLERKVESEAVKLYRSLPPELQDYFYEEGISAHLLNSGIFPTVVRNKEKIYVGLKEGVNGITSDQTTRDLAIRYINKVLDSFYEETLK